MSELKIFEREEFVDWRVAKVNDPQLPGKDETFFGRVYILDLGDMVKIGCTSNLNQRVSDLGSLLRLFSEVDIKKNLIAYSEPHTNFAKNESALHKIFSSSKVRGEFFNVSLYDALKASQLLTLDNKSAEMKERSEKVTSLFKSLVKGELIPSEHGVHTESTVEDNININVNVEFKDGQCKQKAWLWHLCAEIKILHDEVEALRQKIALLEANNENA